MPSPSNHLHYRPQQLRFQSTVSAQKLRRINALVLLLRFATFCFSFASAAFMATNVSSSSLSWLHSDPFRVVLAANAIAAVYSFAEMVASIWEILKGVTLFPEATQLWFDFIHDQVFAYLIVSAAAAAAVEAARVRKEEEDVGRSFCLQSDISIALGFAGFAFLAASALVSAFRLACYLITGSRYHL